ncbi:uncharacterized protein B0I36DRAFT_331489 [Microdochium trichocladiopsis]|uniref:Uncharacterized protein n=1 Tax=Microdochium trichocladiopsis TaxID=1682393 RepID=A0A9P8XYL5_9PEZI|nr:uncharacterized protein B0I36DRAFT_331489 [Microdochium trichocladiopsis]KAH7024480.1 hypothetical protein B0I36DRAFT_331489 [Microdochium trichocladiopsis]
MPDLVFLLTTGQSSGSSAPTDKKVARAAAAREAHARKRRARTAQYQAQRAASGSQALTSATNPWALLAAMRDDPFDTFALTLNRNERFLFDHYITILIPNWRRHASTTRSSLHRPRLREHGDGGIMYNDLARLAITDTGLLTATLLAACRHMSRQPGLSSPRPGVDACEYYITLAMEYKARCVKSVIDDIERRRRAKEGQCRTEGAGNGDRDNETPLVWDRQKSAGEDNMTLTKIIVLALDEIWLGDIPMARHHVLGAMKLVDLNGGPDTLRMGSFVANMFASFLSSSLFSATNQVDVGSTNLGERDRSAEGVAGKDRCVNPCETIGPRFFPDSYRKWMKMGT